MKQAAAIAGGILGGIIAGFIGGAVFASRNYEAVFMQPAMAAQAGELVMLAEIAAAIREQEDNAALVVTEEMLTAGSNGLPVWFPEGEDPLPHSAQRAAESLSAYTKLYGEDYSLQPEVEVWVSRHAEGNHEFLPECLRRYVEENS